MGSDPAVYSLMQTNVVDARARILEALVEVVGERGFAGASVTLVVARAKVSRRTFYEQFNGLEECLMAVMDEAVERTSAVMARAFAGEEDWRDGVRAALAALLTLYDAELVRVRVWQLEVLAAGPRVLAHRERKLTQVRELILGRWAGGPQAQSQLRAQALAVIAEGVLASVLGLIQSRLVAGGEEPLLGLLGPLMGLIVAPFVDEETRELEIEWGAEHAQAILEGRTPNPDYLPAASVETPAAASVEIPAALLLPGARRSRQCLRYLAQHPGVSNYRVGKDLGIVHQSQTSRLLARLAGIGLLAKLPGAPGHPNAWTLTPEGQRVAQALEKYH
jgi:AcrR family transcriptional regulator